MKLNFFVLLLFFFANFFVCSYAQVQIPTLQIQQNITQINAYYSQSTEQRPRDKVIKLATDIIENRSFYETDVIGKTYALLADMAALQADSARAFQFAIDGLSLSSISETIKLNLLQKLANGYYANGQYQKTISIATESIQLAKEVGQTKYQLISLGYRGMAYALVARYSEANRDLTAVNELISNNPQFSEYIELLDILAVAHHYLGDFNAAIAMHNQILTLKLANGHLLDISKTYYNLASSYKALSKFDDAHNAYWQAEKSIDTKYTPIRFAYIQLGLGEMLLMQQQFEAAYQKLKLAEFLLLGKNQAKPYLSTLIFLAKAANATGRHAESKEKLLIAQQLATGTELSENQIALYPQLQAMYEQEGNYEKANVYLKKHLDEYKKFHPKLKKPVTQSESQKEITKHSRELARKLSQEADVNLKNARATQYQEKFILLLIFSSIILVLLLAVLWLRRKTLILMKTYQDNERPPHFLFNPNQIKQQYQLNYKKSRKYEYPLSVAFIIITNWQELNTRVNKRILAEVSKEFATLMNTVITEFDELGQLTDGQYLLICPHQQEEEIKRKLIKIQSLLKVSFFANLGDFHLEIDFSSAMPLVQDIDPYIFLAKLSERVTAKYLDL